MKKKTAVIKSLSPPRSIERVDILDIITTCTVQQTPETMRTICNKLRLRAKYRPREYEERRSWFEATARGDATA